MLLLLTILLMLFLMIVFLMSSSFMMMWVFLECNTLLFLIVISLLNQKQKFSVISSYFLIQTLGSSMFLVSLSMMNSLNFSFVMNMSYLIYNFSLSMKLGLFPFHIWVVNLVKYMNWLGVFMLASLQKLMPMMMLSWCFMNNYILFIVMMSMLVSFYNSIGLVSVKLIFSYSMLSHSAWMTLMLKFLNWWAFYYFFYSVLFFLVCWLNYIMTLEDFSDYVILKFLPSSLIYMYIINLISLGGMPPLLGFVLKWIIMDMLFMNISYFILFMLVITSVIHLYVYMRVVVWGLMLYTYKSYPMKCALINYKKSFTFSYMFFTLFFNFMLIFFVIMI